jgi:hypothetical protein
MTSSDDHQNSQLIVHPGHYGRPENEVPFALATPDMMWHGDGTLIAVPSLLVYSTGVELLILGFSQRAWAGPMQDGLATAQALHGLTVSGRQIDLLGGHNTAHGFHHPAWRPFLPDLGGRDLVFALHWPDVEAAEHRVPAVSVADAISRVRTLWP